MTPQARLDRVETLLGEALDDLKQPKREAPAVRCAAALAEASGELQALAQEGSKAAWHPAAFRARLTILSAKLRRVERLLAAAVEFYAGWCAAGSQAGHHAAPSYSEHGYQAAGWSNPGPALLAFRG